MIERLLRMLFPNQDIEHEGSLYLRRWLLTPSIFGFRMMLHKIARPDRERVLHDHPWDFATLCLRGGYVESVYGPRGTQPETLTVGQVRFRAAEHAHRIERILGPNAWTLVLHGPRRRKWGFWSWPSVDGLMAGRGIFTESSLYFKPGYDKATPMQRRAR